MHDLPEDICPRPPELPDLPAVPHAPPIWPASVYRCESPEQADQVLSGESAGYLYLRDGHPNADLLAEKCRHLHHAEKAAITSTGMSAMALVLLSQVEAGDRIVLSHQLYGRTAQLLTQQATRLGATTVVVNTGELDTVAAALDEDTKLLVVETITNPQLRVSNIPQLAELAHQVSAKLVVDNTFASPLVFCPLQHGADLVVESLTKSMNGHSDVTLGLLCGRERDWANVPNMLSMWGMTSSPFDCWLACRGVATLAVRAKTACANALAVAESLSQHPAVESTLYPGLVSHADHALASALFRQQYGSIVTFSLPGGRAAVERFIAAVQDRIPFCPSLGELSTTLSHPTSTSHRGLSGVEQANIGISPGMLRLSVGIESAQMIVDSLEIGLAACER